ncbi:MAG: hypothetical protein WD044_04175 [Dongiaceae bacterium]
MIASSSNARSIRTAKPAAGWRAGALGAGLAFVLAASWPLASAADETGGPLVLTPWEPNAGTAGTSSSGSFGVGSDPTGASSSTGAGTTAGTGTLGSSSGSGTGVYDPTTTPEPVSTAPLEPTVPEGERAPEGITVNTLDDTPADYGGTLEPSNGGFGYEMWQGTDRSVVEQLLPQMPIRPLSPSMRDLARRLLLSAAAPPTGHANADLTAIRAERLRRLGNAADIAAFLALMNSGNFNAESARLQVDALLLDGRREEACTAVRSHIAAFDSDLYLQKAFAFCQMIGGDQTSAMLASDLIFEQGENDPIFFSLMNALDGDDSVTIDSLPEATPLHLTMLDEAGLAPPADLVQSEDPLLLAALARNDALASELRLAAAEQAAARGSLPVEALTELYRSEPADAYELDTVMDQAVGVVPPRVRALLYKATTTAPDPALRARYLQRSLELAREHGGYLLAAQVAMPELRKIVPSDRFAWFAVDAARALYVLGQNEAAGAWFALIRRMAPNDPVAAEALPTIWLYARVAGASDPAAWDASSLDAWRATQQAGGAEADHALRLYAVFDGLGEPVGNPSDVLIGNDATASVPNSAYFFNLADAASGARRGETVLLSLLNLGEGGPGAVSPIVLSRVLRSLREVGLTNEARSLAFEAIVAAGI